MGLSQGPQNEGFSGFLFIRSVIAMQRYENFCINKCFSKEKLTQFFKFSRDVTRRFHFAFSRRPEKQHIWRFFLLLEREETAMEHPIFACSMAVFCVNKVGRHGGNPHAFSPKKTKHKGVSCRNTTKSITLPCGRIIRQRDNTFGRGRPIWGKSNLAQGKRSQSGVSPWVYGFPPIIATYRGKGKHWAS